jgi:hypothetical protein
LCRILVDEAVHDLYAFASFLFILEDALTVCGTLPVGIGQIGKPVDWARCGAFGLKAYCVSA